MTKEVTEKIALDKEDRDFVIEHLMNNMHKASLLEMSGMATAWATAAGVFSENTAEKGSTE